MSLVSFPSPNCILLLISGFVSECGGRVVCTEATHSGSTCWLASYVQFVADLMAAESMEGFTDRHVFAGWFQKNKPKS